MGSGSKNSEEKLTGADGIITIKIITKNERCFSKSVLFQAKKKDYNRTHLEDQKAKMLKVSPSGSMIIWLTENGFEGQSVLSNSEKGFSGKSKKRKFGEYMNDIFLACKQGEEGLYDKICDSDTNRLNPSFREKLINELTISIDEKQ